MGPTFCGVTGSSSIACRWDISGPPAARAARLMQYAVEQNLEVAIDSSLFNDPVAATRMALLDSSVQLKGASQPCAVYRLSASKLYSVFRVLEPRTLTANNEAVQQVYKYINTGRTRCAVVVTGIPFSGKRVVCQRAAALSDLVPYIHVCDVTTGLAQLARIIATWYSYVGDEIVRSLARVVVEHMEHKRWSRAHDECVSLVDIAIKGGLKACFVIDRIHFLDSFSLSILRESLHRKSAVPGRRSSRIFRYSSTLTTEESSSSDASIDLSRHSCGTEIEKGNGKIVFLGVHISLYQQKSATDIVHDITRSSRLYRTRIVEVGEASLEELQTAVRESMDVEAEDRWLRCYSEATGNCLYYFLRRANTLRLKTERSADRNAYEQLTKALALHISPGYVGKNMPLPVSQVSAEISMKLSQLFDELPLLFQILSKVLAVATRRALFKLPKIVAWEVMNDLIAEGMGSDSFLAIVDEMKEIYLLTEETDGGIEKISYQNSALADIARDVCTPSQISCISEALIYRLEPLIGHNFSVPFLIAELYHELGRDGGQVKNLWRKGYASFLDESKEWPQTERDWWLEKIADIMSSDSYDAEVVLRKEGFCTPDVSQPIAPSSVLLLHSYVAPISFGPLGHTLSVISRGIFHEYGFMITEDKDSVDQVHASVCSACQRYLRQVGLLEQVMTAQNLLSCQQGEDERALVEYFSSPNSSVEMAELKEERFINEFLKDCVVPRMHRLRALTTVVANMPTPSECVSASKDMTIAAAYNELQSGRPNRCLEGRNGRRSHVDDNSKLEAQTNTGR